MATGVAGTSTAGATGSAAAAVAAGAAFTGAATATGATPAPMPCAAAPEAASSASSITVACVMIWRRLRPLPATEGIPEKLTVARHETGACSYTVRLDRHSLGQLSRMLHPSIVSQPPMTMRVIEPDGVRSPGASCMLWQSVVYRGLLGARRDALRVATSGQDALPHPVYKHASQLEARPRSQRAYCMPTDALAAALGGDEFCVGGCTLQTRNAQRPTEAQLQHGPSLSGVLQVTT